MNGLKNFILGSLGTLGVMEITDFQFLSHEEPDAQSLILRSVLSLLAGLLSALFSKRFRRYKSKHNSNEFKHDSFSKLFKNKKNK